MSPLLEKPILHGRDHLEGGADPIPGLTGAAGDFQTAVLAIPDLLAYWRLGETATPWADTSGVAPTSDMVETGSGTALTPDVTGALPEGQDDGAVEFNYDGTGGSGGRYLQAGGLGLKDFGLTELTVACWVNVKASALSRRGLIIGNSINPSTGKIGWGLQVIYPARTVRFTLGDVSTVEKYVTTSGGVVAGEWNLFVGTYDATTIRLYANGVLLGETVAAALSNDGDGSGTVRIGFGFCEYVGAPTFSAIPSWLYGTADEAAVWTRALDPDEIATLNASGTGTTGPAEIGDGSIFDRHVNTAADIDPAKLDHPGGTSSFLRADGTWAAPPGSGGVATDTIWNAKGDLAAASANDTAARLPVGSNDQVLVADSGQTLGIKWAAVPGTSAFVPVATVDAKGDLLVGTANDALDNLPVGSNNQVLTADSAQTMGVKWAAAASGAVATDTIWDTKGDLAVASAADAASKLAVGSNDQVLTADSGQTLGVKWATPSAGSAGALTLLSTTTLSGAGTFDVSSISGSYNDLILVLIARGAAAATIDTTAIRFNNDSAGNYYRQRLTVNGTTATAAENQGQTSLFTGNIVASTGLASAFGVVEIELFGYAATTWKKMARVWSMGPESTSAAGLHMVPEIGLWNSTAAITRVQIAGTSTANLVTGSVLRIYGRL